MMEGSPVNSPDKILEIAMNEGLPATWPKTAEEIFRDFRGRRAGLIKALTTDARQFYQLCDPKKDLLCLYGLPNGTWKVGPPAEEVPTNIPEPILGINIARDGSSEKDWLTMIALHCDSWLISVAFYIGAFSEIKKIDRDRLFQMINDYPTVLEVVLECAKQPTDHFGIPDSSSIIKSSRKPRQPKKMTMAPKESRQPKNHTSMPMKMTMAPKESRQPVNFISMPMKMTMAPKESRQPMNFMSMPMKMTMAPKESRQPVNFISMPMKMTMEPEESRQPMNFINMPMKMTMAPKESRQPVNFISMPMKMTMEPEESRQPMNFINMPMKMTMAPKESRQPVNFISMPMKMTMAPMESRQPMNFISMPMKMTMAPMESRQPVNHTSMPMKMTMAPKEHETRVEVHEGQGITLCGACGKKDGPGEFRICCDTCHKWFHGLCVAMTREDAEHIMHFKCPYCRGKQKLN